MILSSDTVRFQTHQLEIDHLKYGLGRRHDIAEHLKSGTVMDFSDENALHCVFFYHLQMYSQNNRAANSSPPTFICLFAHKVNGQIEPQRENTNIKQRSPVPGTFGTRQQKWWVSTHVHAAAVVWAAGKRAVHLCTHACTLIAWNTTTPVRKAGTFGERWQKGYVIVAFRSCLLSRNLRQHL